VNRDLIAAMGQRCSEQKIATVDQDTTIIESRKREALATYEGERGYQPMLTLWAEMNLVLADQFRDGNVPALMDPLPVAQAAFGALPATVQTFYYRGDSACHEHRLISWLRDEEREGGPRGFIGFAISARMSEALHTAILALPGEAWQPEKNDAEVLRDCAEVAFVPSERSEKKDLQPLRYVAVGVRKRQGELFGDGSAVKHFAVVTNIWEWEAARLLEWHRGKAGTIEVVHDVIKNELAAGVLPCGRFGSNAAWLRLAVLTYNVLTALKRLGVAGGTADGPSQAVAVSDLPYARTDHSSCAAHAVAVGSHAGADGGVDRGYEAATGAATSLTPEVLIDGLLEVLFAEI